MIKNYFKIAWRNIARNKVNSFINITGLAIGLASVLFILMYVQDELKYDRFFKKAGTIYQVNLEGNFAGQAFFSGTTPPPAGAALANSFPEIESYTRVYGPGDQVVRYEEGKETAYFNEKNVKGVDSNFLDLLNYRLLEGNASTCLLLPNSVVITSQVAEKYFGSKKALGEILLFGDRKQPFTVTGILGNIPAQSSLQFDMLRPMASYPAVKQFSWSWVWTQLITYVRLRENVANDKTALAKLDAKFPAMVKQQAASAFRRIGQPFEEFEKKGGKYNLHLQPITAVHLHSAGINSAITTLSDIKYVYIFSLVAFFIIILACVNFMNLSTAQSSKRAKEVGIRKVLGSLKGSLVRQFLAEAFVHSLIAMIIALALVIIFIHPFNHLSGKELSLDSLLAPGNLASIAGLIMLTGLLAGSYPSFYLTSFRPAAVLKGKLMKTSLGNLFLRNGLVIFQFTIATALIICSIIIYQQMQFTRNKNMGLNKDNLLVISNTSRLGPSEEAFRQELEGISGISTTSISTSYPTQNVFTDSYVPPPANNEQLAKDISLSSFIVDNNFVPALQLQVLQGRNFSKDFADSSSVIVNETTVKQIGWQNPIGQYLQYTGNNNQLFKVIGVVKDFNIQSFHNAIIPFALFHTSSKTYDLGISYTLAKINTGDLHSIIDKAEKKWKSFAASTPFEYSFLDEEFNALYQSDKRMGAVFGVFTLLSIFVACLGLFGLAAFTAEKRTKEIGVRKVLGASVPGLVKLLSKDFIKLVLLASVIAFPLAGWGMHKWLQDFVYRVDVKWWVFIIAGTVTLLIALLTVSFRAIKAAIANPVKSLRTE